MQVLAHKRAHQRSLNLECERAQQLRLQAARQRMLLDGVDATSAAYEVGYESASQFSREYSRFFGQPPMRDVRALRDNSVVPGSAA